MNAIILAIVEKEDSYGYALCRQARKIIPGSYNAVYKLLHRLVDAKCLDTYDLTECGRLRRYYRFTDNGRRLLVIYRNEWIKHKKIIDVLLFCRESDDSLV